MLVYTPPYLNRAFFRARVAHPVVKHRFMIHENKKHIFRRKTLAGCDWFKPDRKILVNVGDRASTTEKHCLLFKKLPLVSSSLYFILFKRIKKNDRDVFFSFPFFFGPVRSDGKRDSPAPDAINSLLTKQTLNRGPPLRKYSLLYVIKTGIRYGHTEHVDKINW